MFIGHQHHIEFPEPIYGRQNDIPLLTELTTFDLVPDSINIAPLRG
jgi:hypothetical protein